MKYIPSNFPIKILEFIQNHINLEYKRLGDRNLKEINYPTISDYYDSIPDDIVTEHKGILHHALLKTYQLMTNEGILTAMHSGIGMEERYFFNEFNPNDAKYGKYDFRVLGFPYVHDLFSEAVRPIIINENIIEKDPDIGTGFVVNYNRGFDKNFYFITARHCLPLNDRVYIPAFLPPKKPCVPETIWVTENENIDIAVIKFVFEEGIPCREEQFWLSEPQILDEILTMGYPPIQGFIDAIQVTEISRIAGFLRSSNGRIVGEGKHYWGGLEDHFLISARVKGGNSGGPVVNREGEVVGLIIELLKDGQNIDALGYGVALDARVIKKVLDKIEGKSNEIEINECQFELFDDGFEVKSF